MPSQEIRDRMLRECWVDARHQVPDALPAGNHFPVEVWGVIKDPVLAKNEPYMDVVSYWPSARKWTVTHFTRASQDASDYVCEVTHWQPLPPLPWT